MGLGWHPFFIMEQQHMFQTTKQVVMLKSMVSDTN